MGRDGRGRIAQLVDAGRITPAQAEGLAEFAAQLPAGEVLEFSRGAGEGQTPEQVKTSPDGMKAAADARVAGIALKVGAENDIGLVLLPVS